MSSYVWLLPIIFIFHDMEEIIGLITWYTQNKVFLDTHYPRMGKVYDQTSTEGFAIAVYEQLFICIMICMISLVTHHYELWLGVLIGLTLHFIVHIVQSILIKRYIPAVATSILMLPISILLTQRSVQIIGITLRSILVYSLLGTSIIIVNLKFAHKLMKRFTSLQIIIKNKE